MGTSRLFPDLSLPGTFSPQALPCSGGRWPPNKHLIFHGTKHVCRWLPCWKTVPSWAFSKHLLRGPFLSSWNHTSPKQSMCTSVTGIIALSQNILSPVCLSHQTGSFYRAETRTLIFESLVDVAGWLNGCAGGVRNFLRSVLLQQKLEATDGPVLQPLDRPVLQLSFI